MKKSRSMIRQGDVMLRPVTEVPLGAQMVKRVGGRVILAEGEVTGHHHAIRDSGVGLLEIEGRRFLRVPDAGAELQHEEHSTIKVEPGLYEVVIQREYDDAEDWRRVAD